MRNNSFTFNGRSSDEFGIKIERFRPLNRPPRKYDAAAVSGRNGNIYKLQDAWEEILVSYEIFAGDRKNGATIASWENTSSVTFNDAAYSDKVVQELTFYFPKTYPIAPNIITVNINGNENITFPVPMYGGTYDYINGILTVTSDSNGDDLPEPAIYKLDAHSVTTISGANCFGIVTPPSATIQMLSIGYEATLERQWTEIIEWLNSTDGYAELTDSFDPEHYREAVFVDSADIANSWNHYGRAVVSFHCRPERFLFGYKNVTLDLSTLYGLVSEGKQFSPVLTQAAAQSPSNPKIGTVTNIPFEILGEANGYYRVKTYYGLDGYVLKTDVYTMNGAKFTNPTNNIAKPKVYIDTQNTSGFETWVVMLNNDPSEVTASYKRRNIKYSMTYAQTDDRQRCLDCENENIYTLYYEDSLDQLFRVEVTENINPYVAVTYSDDTATPEFFALNPNDNIILCNGFVDGITMDARIWEK